MAVSFVSSAVTFGNGTTRSVSLDAGTGSDRAVVGGGYDVNLTQTVIGMQYNAVSMTEESTSGVLKAFSLAGVPTGVNILSLTLSAYSKPMLVGGSFDGVDQADPAGTPTTNSAAGSVQSTANTTAPTDGMIWGVMRHSYASSARTISGAGNTLAGSIRDGSNGRGAAGGYRSSSGVISWGGGGSPSYNAIALPLNAAGGGGTNITPATGDITLSGQDVTVTETTNISVNSTSIPISGKDVSVMSGTNITPSKATITLQGQTVDIVQETNIQPASADIVLTGQDVSITSGAVLQPAKGALSLAGQSVTVTATRLISVAKGMIQLIGKRVPRLTKSALGTSARKMIERLVEKF